jgi:putative membrane protein
MQEWFSASTKTAVKAAVREAESQTNAEVVVAVRRISGTYLHADMIGGLVAAFAALAVFLYYPEPFEYTFFPLEQLGAFILGALATHAATPLRRALAGKRLMETSVARAARSAFMEHRLGRTKKREAVLVFASTFERQAFVVPDVGIDLSRLGETWGDAVKILNRAVREDDIAAFTLAVQALGPILSNASPHTADDANELPDDVDSDEEASE